MFTSLPHQRSRIETVVGEEGQREKGAGAWLRPRQELQGRLSGRGRFRARLDWQPERVRRNYHSKLAEGAGHLRQPGNSLFLAQGQEGAGAVFWVAEEDHHPTETEEPYPHQAETGEPCLPVAIEVHGFQAEIEEEPRLQAETGEAWHPTEIGAERVVLAVGWGDGLLGAAAWEPGEVWQFGRAESAGQDELAAGAVLAVLAAWAVGQLWAAWQVVLAEFSRVVLVVEVPPAAVVGETDEAAEAEAEVEAVWAVAVGEAVVVAAVAVGTAPAVQIVHWSFPKLSELCPVAAW